VPRDVSVYNISRLSLSLASACPLNAPFATHDLERFPIQEMHSGIQNSFWRCVSETSEQVSGGGNHGSRNRATLCYCVWPVAALRLFPTQNSRVSRPRRREMAIGAPNMGLVPFGEHPTFATFNGRAAMRLQLERLDCGVRR